jgi:hypothetical protein
MLRLPRLAHFVTGLLFLHPALAHAQSQQVEVQITGLDDVGAVLPSLRPASITLSDEVCVLLDGRSQYRVSVAGQGPDGLALQRPGSTEQLPISVVWDDHRGSTQQRDTPGPLGTFDVSGIGCGASGHLASFEVRIDRAALLSVTAGSYQGGILLELSAL